MLKEISNTLVACVVGVGLLLAPVTPAVLLVRAEVHDPFGLTRPFCTLLSGVSSTIRGRVNNRAAAVDEKKAELSLKVQERRAEREARWAERRDRRDARRAELYAKLEERADTDAKKQAGVAFKVAVEAAVQARRDAIDAAVVTFRQDFDAVHAARKESVDGAKETYRNSANAALDQAAADCESGDDRATVRETLRASLSTARDQLRSDRAGLLKFRDDVTPLLETRKAAIATAIEDFKAAMETARDDFKAVFAETTGNGTEDGTGEGE